MTFFQTLSTAAERDGNYFLEPSNLSGLIFPWLFDCFEETSNGLASVLLELAKNQRVQDSLREEIDKHIVQGKMKKGSGQYSTTGFYVSL